MAGVTILAFGNGDVFTALMNPDEDTEMLLAELYGGALFIIGFVAAMIIVVKPFTVERESFIRDLVFFIVACVWTGRAFRDEHYTWIETNGAIVIYLLYLTVVVVQEYFRKDVRMVVTSRAAVGGSVEQSGNGSANEGLKKQFLHSIFTFAEDEWRESGLAAKVVIVLKVRHRLVANQFDWVCFQMPAEVTLNMVLPIIDYSMENNGWSKLLNSIQVVLLPMVLIFLKQCESQAGLETNITLESSRVFR